ncbi:MAG TPA: response regulator transcription factor [Lapillicoccus sp.]|nr:response regulator transcription factor [Lapillicoccus sp.]
MIRVLLAEDQGLMRSALAALLALEDDLDVVGQVARVADIVPAVQAGRPDVALLDIELADGNALDVAPAVRSVRPDCAVVFLTTFGRPGYLRRAFDAGARGFLVKDGPVEELAASIRLVHDGRTVVDPELAAAALADGRSPLTDRERDVLAAASDGATTKDVAGRLHLSEHTVRNYLSSAIGKTGTRTRAEAYALAERNGWL